MFASRINFRLTDGHLRGLQLFEILKFNFRILRPSLEFEIFFKQLVLDGQHTTRATFGIIPVSGRGPMTMVFNDVRVVGTFRLGTINGNFLNVEKIYFGAFVGSVDANLRGFGTFLDPAINGILSNGLPTFINEGQDRVNEIVAQRVVPAMNAVLNQFRLIDLIIAIITRSEAPFTSTCQAAAQ